MALSAAIILAAGEGTRMRSNEPKVLHTLAGKTFLNRVMDSVSALDPDTFAVVVHYQAERVAEAARSYNENVTIVNQDDIPGTGRAVQCAMAQLTQQGDWDGAVLIAASDMPLLDADTLSQLLAFHEKSGNGATVLTTILDDPTGYGRIIRDADGQVERIVEQKDATPEEAAVNECNSGFYCFDARALFDALDQVSNNNAQGEFYLTDVLEICRNAGRPVLALATDDAAECLGVNSRIQLAQVTKVMQRRINHEHMAAGVTMVDPDQVWIGPDVKIAQDVELLPQVMLMGATEIGEDSVVGPNTRLTDAKVGRGCVIEETVAIEAQLDDAATAGPRAYLRSGTHLCEGAKAGTHVEIKKSTIGRGSKVPHLSYIGDTTMGEGVNIGAGSITCNYDGKKKWPTTIGDNVFVGSDTMMVAPVTIGDGAIIGAASCITKEVAPDALALTRPEQKEIPGWAAKKRARQAAEGK